MPASAPMLTSLQALLTGAAGLVALVGSHIYAGQAPQGVTLPLIVWHVIASPVEYTQDGDGLSETVIQFDIDGATQTDCRAVADALVTLLSGKRITQGATLFAAIFHDGTEFTGVEESLVPSTTQSHRLIVVYRFLHQAT